MHADRDQHSAKQSVVPQCIRVGLRLSWARENVTEQMASIGLIVLQFVKSLRKYAANGLSLNVGFCLVHGFYYNLIYIPPRSHP